MYSLQSNDPGSSGLQFYQKKKKDTSCNLNSQHCIQERNEYTIERVSGQNFLVKGVWTFKRHA